MPKTSLDQRPALRPVSTSCPHCGAGVRGEVRDIGTFFSCAECDTDWVEDLALDFRTD